MLARGDYFGDEEALDGGDGDHRDDESDTGDDNDDIIIGQNSRFSTSGPNSSTCLPRDSPKTAPVGGFGGKVIR